MGVQWRKVVSVPIWCWKKSWQGFSWRCSSNLILREQQLKEEWHVRADTWTRSGLDRRGERSRGAFTHGCVCVCEWHEATGKGKLLHVFACTVPTNHMQCRTEVCVFMCVCTCNGSWHCRGASSNSGWTDKDMWQHPGRFICQHRSERSHNDDSRRPIETPTTHTCTQSYLQPPMRSP